MYHVGHKGRSYWLSQWTSRVGNARISCIHLAKLPPRSVCQQRSVPVERAHYTLQLSNSIEAPHQGPALAATLRFLFLPLLRDGDA